MAVVITLTGASQCGKGVVMDMILKKANGVFNPVVMPKHVTRPIRETDGIDVIGGGVPDYCDLVYEQNNQRYGIKFDDLFDYLAQGKSPVLVLNDIRAVEDVRNVLSPQVISIFIYRRQPKLEEFIEIERERYKGKDVKENVILSSANLRYQKAYEIYRIYIENISLFDNVILNTGSIDQTNIQVMSIINKIIDLEKQIYERN